jgi:hypothetical protein
MIKLPELKKKIKSFLTKEDGKISKENLLKTGIFLTILSTLSLKEVNSATPSGCDTYENHSNFGHYNTFDQGVTIGTIQTENIINGTHGHHANQCTHDSGSGCSGPF